MTGIRVTGIPEEVTEKHLKVYFSNPNNGGGAVRQIYYPLQDNCAVILFESPSGEWCVMCYRPYMNIFGGFILFKISIIVKNVCFCPFVTQIYLKCFSFYFMLCYVMLCYVRA